MENKVLIFSPHADFTRRMEVLCSGIVLANILGRIPMYYWPGGECEYQDDLQCIKPLRKYGLEHFFIPHPNFTPAALNTIPNINRSFSEWLPSEYWYEKQSSAHQLWGKTPDFRCEEILDVLEGLDDPIILIETSKRVRLSKYSKEEWQHLMSKAYKEHFKPSECYISKLHIIPPVDIGIHIQRGEFLHYFPEESHSKDVLQGWIDTIGVETNGESVLLVSDDNQLQAELCEYITTKGIECINLKWEGLEPHEIRFLEFLTLAYNVSQKVYGTPKSKFGEQAALFGGVDFDLIKPNNKKKVREESEIQKYKISGRKDDFVTIAILVKDKAHVLPMYLQLIERQTYPASKIKLYIRTNNNRDNTLEILRDWIGRVGDRYSEIYFDSSDVEDPVQDYAPHEWNPLRLNVLGKIRKESTEWARQKGTHYFVVDCDNFIIPETLEMLLNTGLPVIGPLLRLIDNPLSMYSNYHFITDENGYLKDSPYYSHILYKAVKGLIEVEVIHCTYLIRQEVLDKVEYVDGSGRFEYVIFSDTLRKAKIPQYIDNRVEYGCLTFYDTVEEFSKNEITAVDFF